MAYNLMKSLIAKKTKTKAWLTKRANVFLAAEQLEPEQYTELMELINAMQE